MGSYILSLSPMAKHPYRTRELGVDIYTAEELCYYIYHNFVVVDDDFISRELFEFLEDELKLGDHVAHIRKYIEDKPSMELTLLFICEPHPVPLSEFVEVVIPPVRFTLGIHPALAIDTLTSLLLMANCERSISGRLNRACS